MDKAAMVITVSLQEIPNRFLRFGGGDSSNWAGAGFGFFLTLKIWPVTNFPENV
ncbi:hypothetical protein [Azomonas macrocytogenes]|uniref:Uncharacterized protein n=1 Tax=Azomonas macrocytogenes TaxID=69962 RepID=A0A839T465_AZOMA|nr:hypothetical protein [Azomonas macrocytogenes]MBB3104212.1 hypothetical protein [Azomonas macrocytogenes]